jgi:hypothetical protein
MNIGEATYRRTAPLAASLSTLLAAAAPTFGSVDYLCQEERTG